MRVEDLQVMYEENKLYRQPPQYDPLHSKWWRTATKLSLCVYIKMLTIHRCPVLTSWQLLFFTSYMKLL